MTDAQTAAIVTLNQAYNKDWFSRQSRTSDLTNQLADLVKLPAPDPQQIGARAVELETIRRDLIAKQGALQTQVVGQLTASQSALISSLVTAVTLQPLAYDATCAYLVKSRQSQWFSTPVFASLTWDGSLFPNSLASLLPAPVGTFCGSPTFPISVREYLSLTAAQVAALYSASAAYNDLVTRKQARSTELRQQINSLVSAGAADATVLGLLYAEMASIVKEINAQAAQLRDAAQSQLTPAQTVKMKTLQDMQDLNDNGIVSAAIGCNLLVLPSGSSDPQIPGGVSNCSLN